MAFEAERGRLVVHCEKEPFDVLIDRTTKWGNPFHMNRSGCYTSQDELRERERVIKAYEAWLRNQPELMVAVRELRGKVLGCWCAPKPCHGDVLVRLANDGDAPR